MMDKQERSALTAAFCNVVREYVAKTEEKLSTWVSGELRALSDLFEERIKAIPEPKPGKDGRDGKDADLEEVRKAWEERYSHIPTFKDWNDSLVRIIDQLPKPKDGKDAEVDLNILERMVDARVLARLSEIPLPKDGQDGAPAPPVDTASLVNEVLRSTRDYVAEEVMRGMSALPPPKDGRDGLPGTPGTSIVIGEGPPLSAGKPGDIYLDATTGEIYKEEEVHVASNGKH